MTSKMYEIKGKFFAIILLMLTILNSCKQGDDVIVFQPQRNWITRTVAVVAPIGYDAHTRMRLERTAQWFLNNFREAQLHDTLAISLNLEWYDELSENLESLSQQLAERSDIVAIVGPFGNQSVARFAPACQKVNKPLIVPTATSEEIIRRYAVPTATGFNRQQPFLWSLTETDVSFIETLMSGYATYGQYYSHLDGVAKAAIFTPNDVYGQTFNYWAPFFAVNENVNLLYNYQFDTANDLIRQLNDYLTTESKLLSTSNFASFCVVENVDMLYQTARAHRQWGLDNTYGFLGITDPDSPEADNLWQSLVTIFSPYFAFANISDEAIASIGERGAKILQGYQGFSPYADPATGFELSYEKKFGTKPTFAECKFYDALLLSAFAIFYREHFPTMKTDSNNPSVGSLNQAIIDITSPTATEEIGGAAWAPTAMEVYLAALEKGVRLHFIGASSDIIFDSENYTTATHTTYVQWQILDGNVIHRSYFGGMNNRTADPTAAWKHIYNKRKAEADFDAQASGSTDINYSALSDQYAVLVQGSNGFDNYRHLADVLSVYQLLRKGGFDDDHIIVVADKKLLSSQKVIRANVDGNDLYGGTDGLPPAVIDYDNASLTASDISSILQGKATERLITVLPQDSGHNVFFYWSGHGHSLRHSGINEFAWCSRPSGEGFTVDMLSSTLSAATFRKMLIVAEPCYAEAVVKGINNISGVLAISGASEEEQSWADNWSNEAMIWLSDRFTQNVVECLWNSAAISYRDLFLYCAQHTLGSHARIVNADRFGNLYHEGPEEFIVKQ